MDECLIADLEEQAVCKPHERCLNTDGSYRCMPACPTGYQADPSDIIRCVDVDECESGSHTCTLAEK